MCESREPRACDVHRQQPKLLWNVGHVYGSYLSQRNSASQDAPSLEGVNTSARATAIAASHNVATARTHILAPQLGGGSGWHFGS